MIKKTEIIPFEEKLKNSVCSLTRKEELNECLKWLQRILLKEGVYVKEVFDITKMVLKTYNNNISKIYKER